MESWERWDEDIMNGERDSGVRSGVRRGEEGCGDAVGTGECLCLSVWHHHGERRGDCQGGRRRDACLGRAAERSKGSVTPGSLTTSSMCTQPVTVAYLATPASSAGLLLMLLLRFLFLTTVSAVTVEASVFQNCWCCCCSSFCFWETVPVKFRASGELCWLLLLLLRLTTVGLLLLFLLRLLLLEDCHITCCYCCGFFCR